MGSAVWVQLEPDRNPNGSIREIKREWQVGKSIGKVKSHLSHFEGGIEQGWDYTRT